MNSTKNMSMLLHQNAGEHEFWKYNVVCEPLTDQYFVNEMAAGNSVFDAFIWCILVQSVKQSITESDYSSLSRAEVKFVWRYIFSLQYS
jgi:hypothetical protein